MEFCLVPNQSENSKYNLIPVGFNNNQKLISLCMCVCNVYVSAIIKQMAHCSGPTPFDYTLLTRLGLGLGKEVASNG